MWTLPRSDEGHQAKVPAAPEQALCTWLIGRGFAWVQTPLEAITGAASWHCVQRASVQIGILALRQQVIGSRPAVADVLLSNKIFAAIDTRSTMEQPTDKMFCLPELPPKSGTVPSFQVFCYAAKILVVRLRYLIDFFQSGVPVCFVLRKSSLSSGADWLHRLSIA